ncbi:fatty acyl-CoA reductase 1-like [Dysidea avara]|uniref:fatty acyl-CoA reductase 1-like n=1 Tax=Dysidea avara TaxID=196820 RepID=UPI00331A9FD1
MSHFQETDSRMGVKEFYAGKGIFVTGATGFMGKVLVEKLLRSVPDIGVVYILVRQKRGKTSKERLEDLLSSRVFDVLKEQSSNWMEKIKMVEGALEQPDLGLSEEDLRHVSDEVSVVFHTAATIKFDAPLRESLDHNVVGLKHILDVARKIKKLEAFVHTSTAYCQCDRKHIDEVLYPCDFDPTHLLEAKKWMTDHQLELLSPTLVKDMPNTYTYTKKLAEEYLRKEASDLPITVVRPSIVGAAYKEPVDGWVDVITGSTGIIAAFGKGLLKVMKVDIGSIADIIPVDMVDNLIISAAWITAVDKPSSPLVYNFTALPTNACTWADLYSILTPYLTDNPFDQLFRRPYGSPSRPAFLYPIYHFFSHLIPAFVADLMLRLTGRKPQMMFIYSRLSKALNTLEYFTCNRWTWSRDNTEQLWSLMSPEDQELFNFNLHQVHLQSYFEGYCRGIKEFILKDDMTKIPQHRKQITRLRNIRYMFNLLVFIISARLVYLKSELARQIWGKLLNVFFKWLQFLQLPTQLLKI